MTSADGGCAAAAGAGGSPGGERAEPSLPRRRSHPPRRRLPLWPHGGPDTLTGGDVTGLAEALAYDDRIGGRLLRPGPGSGGGCPPKGIRAFAHRAEEPGAGQAVGFPREVDDINERRRARTVDLVREPVGGDLAGVRVTALGAAFKPDSDDIRDAPAPDVASTPHRLGAHVTVVDPAATGNARRSHPQLDHGTDAISAAAGADVVPLTEWNEFRQVAPEAMGAVVNHRRIADGRHAPEPARWRAAGREYRALGSPRRAGPGAQRTGKPKE